MKLCIQTPWISIAICPVRNAFCGDEKFPTASLIKVGVLVTVFDLVAKGEMSLDDPLTVLAIDQTIEEKNGQKVVVGKTATLELKPEQTETLARARRSGVLSLALRSIADANAADQSDEAKKRRQDSVNIVRYGVSTTTTMQK